MDTPEPVFGAFGRIGRRGGIGPVPVANHLLKVAGNHVYGVSSKDGTIQVCTLDGKPVSECTITPPEPKGAELELIKTCERGPKWPGFSKGGTFSFGPDCIVVRGHARLYCFGR